MQTIISLFGGASIVSYIDTAFTIAVAAHALALTIVNVTPTPKDDAIVAKVYGWVEVAAGILHPNVKT